MSLEYTINGEQFRSRMPLEMRWSDCDMLGHVNNAVYLTYGEQARTFYCENLDWDWMAHGIILAKVELNFRKPLLLKDKPFVYSRTTRMGNKSFDMDYVIVDEKSDTHEIVADMKATLVMLNYKTGITFPIPKEVRDKIAAFEGKELG
jgi:acyl-CoA thioester hydrolase